MLIQKMKLKNRGSMKDRVLTIPLCVFSMLNAALANNPIYPFAVSLTEGDTHFCGGVLIRVDQVATACSCLFDFNRQVLYDHASTTAVAGLHSRSKEQIRSAERFSVHRKCMALDTEDIVKEVAYDIGIVYVKTPFLLDNYVRLASLLQEIRQLPPLKFFGVGWNTTNACSSRGRTVQTVGQSVLVHEVVIVPNDEIFEVDGDKIVCEKNCTVGPIWFAEVRRIDRSLHWCGDIGGALFANNIVYGITSKAPSCIEKEFVGEYAKLYEATLALGFKGQSGQQICTLKTGNFIAILLLKEIFSMVMNYYSSWIFLHSFFIHHFNP